MTPTEINWTPMMILAAGGGVYLLLIVILFKVSELKKSPKDGGDA